MSQSPATKARIAFALSLFLLAAAAAAWYAVDAARFAVYEIRSHEPVSGLIPGAPVEFHGVEVGQVHEVRLLDPRNVRVLLQIRRDAPVTTATVATITGRGLATRGFTGYVVVSLEDAGSGGRPLAAEAGAAHPVIASAPSQSVNLDTSIASLNHSVQAASALLEGVLDPATIASLKQSAGDLHQLTRTLAANNARIEAILGNAERASLRMQPLLERSDGVLHTLQGQILPGTQQTLLRLDDLSVLTRARMQGILDHADQASAQLAPLLQASQDTLRSLQTQVLPEAQRSLQRMGHLTITLDEAAVRIRRDPSLLLRPARGAVGGPGEGP